MRLENCWNRRYNPFQRIDGLESALSRQKTLVVPSSQWLVLWRQVREVRKMETTRTYNVERLYSGHFDAKLILDQEPLVDVQMSLRQRLGPSGSYSVDRT